MERFDYEEARETAKEIISFFGGAGSFVSGSDSGLDKWGDPIVTATVVIDGIITPVINYKSNEVNGETILDTDGYVYFHSDDIPSFGSRTTINGVEYRAIAIKTLSSVEDINVYTKIQVRR